MWNKSGIALLTALATVLTVAPSRADDTDIYTKGDTISGQPLVMLSIDVRPSVGQTFNCTGTCLTYFQTDPATKCEFYNGTNGCPTNAEAINSVANLFEYLRLSLKVALAAFEGKGINVGLMINHEDKTGCAGPGNATTLSCATGGMITMGFTSLDTDHYARDRINNQLRGIGAVSNSNGSAGKHPYQGSELFFEFFRYLTGQGIYNGHVGGLDWGGQITKASGAYGPRKVLGVPANDTQKGNHCGPLTAPGTYTGSNSTTATNKPSANSDWYVDDGACWDNSTPSNKHADAVAAVENEAHDTYVSPLTSSCPKIYTINWINGQVNKDSDSNSAITASTNSGGMGISMPSSNGAANVVGALHSNYDFKNTTVGNKYSVPPGGSPTRVVSYFLATGQAGPEVPGIATAGGTSAIAVDGAQAQANPSFVKDIFADIFNQILSVSTTFVAAAIPANVFNRAESLNDVYIAIFQPDADGKRVWTGNIKKLRIAGTANGNQLQDAHSPPENAINPADGRIANTALTFWTDIAKLDPTAFDEITSTPETGWQDGDALSNTDGRQVNRGGAGQQIPGYKTGQANDNVSATSPQLTNGVTGGRTVYYEPSSGTTLADLNVDLSTASALCAVNGPLGLTSLSEVGTYCTPLLKYMRGIDPTSTATPPASRKWLMGDPLHSRPAPINYGALSGYSVDNPAIYLAVSGNDGAMHFIRNTNTGSAECTVASCNNGKEVWAFMPKAAMGIQKTLYLNGEGPHPYGFDGSPTVYTKDADGDGNIESGDKVYIFNGMRRGGRAIYALDVTLPTAPKFLWKIDNTLSNFSELGYTFSNPKVGTVVVDGNVKAALFFGGGYDTNKDYGTSPGVGDDDTVGNAIYVVDAATGDLLWKAKKGGSTGPQSGNIYTHTDMADSIPSDVVIADTDGDGLTDRLVVGDTGGNVWRADFAGGDRSKWSLVLLAKLGRHGVNSPTKADDRRFFHQPKLVQTQDATGAKYDAVLIGSGDREDPLDLNPSGGATNFFYNVRDNNIGILSVVGTTPPAVTPILHSDIADLTSDCLQTGTTSSCGVNLGFGWKIQLDHGVGVSEKALSSPLAINNVVFFTTYLPPPDDGSGSQSCAPAEGTGLLYVVNLFDGTAAYDNGDSSDPDPPTGKDDRTVNLESGGIPAQPVFIPGNVDVQPCVLLPDLTCKVPKTAVRKRSFWQRIEEVPS